MFSLLQNLNNVKILILIQDGDEELCDLNEVARSIEKKEATAKNEIVMVGVSNKIITIHVWNAKCVCVYTCQSSTICTTYLVITILFWEPSSVKVVMDNASSTVVVW